MKKPFFWAYNEFFIEYVKNYERYDVPVQQYHDGYELYLFINGERLFFYNNKCYNLKRGDIAIIRPFELHCAESCDVEFYERYVINFRPDMLSCILTDSEISSLFKDFNPTLLHLDEDQLKLVCNTYKLIDELNKQKNPLSNKATSAALLSLIMTLKAIPQTKPLEQSKGPSEEIIFAINYIGKHYKENITLDLLTDMIHISKFHFCRIFKEATGTTFLEYLNNIRLSHAHRLLVESNLSINDIALKTGFGSAAYFSRMFKKVHGVSPRVARK